MSNESLQQECRNLQAKYEEIESVQARLGLWSQRWVNVRDDLRKALNPDFEDELVDENDELSEDNETRVNRWIREMSRSKYIGIPAEAIEYPALLMLMASSFHLRWKTQFDSQVKQIGNGPWRGRNAEILTTSVPLHCVRLIGDGETTISLVQIECEGDVDVYLAMGNDLAPAETLVIALEELDRGAYESNASKVVAETSEDSQIDVSSNLHELQANRVKIETVRTRIDSLHETSAFSEAFDLSGVFSNDSDFSLLSDVAIVCEQMHQHTIAAFANDGFASSSLSSVAMSSKTEADASAPSTSSQTAVNACRPHGFIVRARQSGLVLLTGWVDQPATSQNV